MIVMHFVAARTPYFLRHPAAEIDDLAELDLERFMKGFEDADSGRPA